MISACFQGKLFNITVIQVDVQTTNAKETEVEFFYDELQDLLKLTTPNKKYLFNHRGLECKNRKSRHTRSKRQVWPWSTKWSRAKTNRVLPRECTSHNNNPLLTTQERFYTWTSPSCQYQNQIDFILCSWRWRSSLQSAKTRPGADSGQIMNSSL